MGNHLRNNIDKCNFNCGKLIKICFLGLTTLVLVASFGCERQKPKKRENTYTVPIVQLVKDYGRLITVANMPTIDQNGTGDRLGLFQDERGTFWGIPLTNVDGKVIGCVSPGLREVSISDILPADTAEVIGAANEPTNWRGGTGDLELLLRNKQGGLIWHSVKEVETKLEPVCWSQSDPVQPLPFYRLVVSNSK